MSGHASSWVIASVAGLFLLTHSVRGTSRSVPQTLRDELQELRKRQHPAVQKPRQAPTPNQHVESSQAIPSPAVSIVL